jgi:sigma-B regulation protein RsbU (phosphoserine phosphatase)
METTFFQRIQKNLLEKRRNLTDWLNITPDSKKQIQLGALPEQDVQTHLAVIDSALEKAEDQTLGICQICHGYVDSNLIQMDYTSSVCLDHLSEPERRQLETELEFLQNVQKALLPQEIPAVPGMEIAVFSRPAQIVGGDYFDFFKFHDGAQGLSIADAMGHGVSASMLMTSLQTALRTLVPENDSPAEVLQRINRLFLHNVEFPTFVTAYLARFEPASHILTYCNAGHNPPLLYREQHNDITWLQPTGPAIGLLEEGTFGLGAVSLSRGDILLLYTDGVTEAIDLKEEEFERDRLAALVQENAELSGQALLQTVRQGLMDFTAGQPLKDDVTILTCKMNDA